MKPIVRLVCLLTSLVTCGSCAVAAERAHGSEPCTKISDLKAKLGKEDKVEILNPGSFHLAEGMWMATPPISAQVPDVDGAAIMTIGKESYLIFTHGKESCVSPIAPFGIPAQWVRALSTAKAGANEKAGPSDELRL